jgi:hypothetical protein
MSNLKMPANNGVLGRQKNLHTFNIDFTDEDGTKYQGRFTTKRLSIADVVTLGVRKSEINGGMYFDPAHPGKGVDAGTDELGAIIAHLEISLKSFPGWWNLSEITNTDILNEVYKEVAEFEESFLRRKESPREGPGSVQAGQGDSSDHLQGTLVGGVSSAVVDEEVQASLEP